METKLHRIMQKPGSQNNLSGPVISFQGLDIHVHCIYRQANLLTQKFLIKTFFLVCYDQLTWLIDHIQYVNILNTWLQGFHGKPLWLAVSLFPSLIRELRDKLKKHKKKLQFWPKSLRAILGLRNRKHVPCFYQVIETWVKVKEN